MQNSFIPEQVLFNNIKQLLDFVRSDFRNEADERNTILYYLFHEVVIDTYDYYEQARELILADITSPKFINIRLFFDTSCAHLPTIHLTLPSEVNQMSYLGNIGDNDDHQDGFGATPAENFYDVFTTSFQSSYNLVVTSQNTFETLIIYHLLKYLVVMFQVSFEMNGFQNMKVSGQDIVVREDLIPVGIFSRSINIEMFYEFKVKDWVSKKIIRFLQLPETTTINNIDKDIKQQIQ
jgi:hypothetical protein